MCGRCRRLPRLLVVLAAGLLIAVICPGWLVAALLIAIAGITAILFCCK